MSTDGEASRSFISGQQRVAAGEQLGLVAVLGEQREGLVGRVGPDVVERGGDHRATSWRPRPGRVRSAAWMADHTCWGEAGMATSVTPSGARASTTALITAGAAPMVPASPMPLTPSGLVGLGVTV